MRKKTHKKKKRKSVLGIVSILSFFVMLAAYAADIPSITVVSGCVFYATVIIAISRFMDSLEYHILNDDR